MTLILGAVAFMSLAISAFAHHCLAKKWRTTHETPTGNAPPASSASPPITMLKPLCGLDDGLRENLLAACQQDYPNFEVIFCATDPSDPALEVAREVQALFPDRPIRVLSGGPRDGLNPKVRSLRRMLAVAEYDWLLVSDSNVRPDAGYLRALASCQEESGTSLVHSLLVGVGGRGLGARLQNLQMNSWVAATIAFADAGNHPSVIGKSMLLRRSALAEVGGFEGVKDLLAEDYVLGLRFGERGLGVALSTHLVPVVGDRSDLKAFVERQVRWAQMRRRAAGALFLGELFVQPLPFFVAFAWFGGIEHQVIALLGMLTKWSLDARTCLRLHPGAAYTSLLLLPFKDALMLLIWAVAGIRTHVRWRGHELKLGPGSKLAPLDPRPLSAVLERA